MKIAKMSEKSYDDFLKKSVSSNAKNLSETYFIEETEAFKLPSNQIHQMLPQGLDSADNHLFSVLYICTTTNAASSPRKIDEGHIATGEVGGEVSI